MNKKIWIPFRILGVLGLVYVATPLSFANQEPRICTMEYRPVCARIKVQCLLAPCPEEFETFGNRCVMGWNPLAEFVHEGECLPQEGKRIENSNWTLKAFNWTAASGAELSFEGDELRASFCNRIGGKYSLDGNRIHAPQLMSTMMACYGEMEKYENAFILSGASIAFWGEETLTITTHKGDRYDRTKIKPLTPENKLHQVLDHYFEKMKAKFPTKESKKELIKQLQNRFEQELEKVWGTLRLLYSTILSALENYPIS